MESSASLALLMGAIAFLVLFAQIAIFKALLHSKIDS